MSGAVHGCTLAIGISGAWLAAAYLPVPLGWLGLFFVGIAFGLRPRLGRMPKGALSVDLGTTPQFRALLDEIAAAIGTNRPDVVLVDLDFNMAFARVGLRRRSVLMVGAPMWVAFDREERVAALAHELGHDVNNDVRRGVWVGGAIEALRGWHAYLRPEPWPTLGSLAEYVAYVVFGLPRLVLSWLADRLAHALIGLTARSHRAAELRADDSAARVAGVDAMVGGLDTAQLATSCIRAMKRARNRHDPNIFDELKDHLAGLPETERERLRRLSARRGVAVDDSHPPTSFRIGVLEHRNPQADAPLIAYRIGIDDELAEVLAEAERRLYDRLSVVEL